MTQLIYLLKTVFISGLLFAYFWIFLRNRFFHGFNRLFLISIPLFSFLLPALHFNLPEFWNRSDRASPIHLLGVAQGGLEEAVTIYAKRNPGHSLSWEWIALMITTLYQHDAFYPFSKNHSLPPKPSQEQDISSTPGSNGLFRFRKRNSLFFL